ncbi:MAG: ATP-dependent DNA helicase RecG [Planctomycetaceae bacterium]|jgi:ATP-dependent DNA helicase RecG|nr:ATP-dependent DNA helicase RecG [Planctomycetaceae bacterium]
MSSEKLDSLYTPVQFLKGVGSVRGEHLNRIGIKRAYDLLFNFPRDYLDLTDHCEVTQLQPDKIQTVAGIIESWESRSTRRGKMQALFVDCGAGFVKALWFNMPFVVRDFAYHRRVMLTGKAKFDHPYWIMMHPQITYLADNEDGSEIESDPFLPIYPLTEGVKQYHLRKIMREILPEYASKLEEVFPQDFLAAHELLPIAEAVKAIHFPASKREIVLAKRRFVYQELFILQLGLAIRRLQHRTKLKATPLPSNHSIDVRIRQRFPFQLTEAQENAIKEILADMSQATPMNRLLQGDVGSGKTVVAIYAMLVAVANGSQAVFMAPTEILARQHLRTINRMLENSRVNVVPLLGGQRPTERAAILQDISSGAANIIVGTQAIVYGEVPFQKLGLVVIDEQHKFGVMQRAALKTNEKFDPHYLVMTATPIPRSVAMTVFGDLDVSVMRGLPPGRQKVVTYISNPEDRAKWWDFVARKIRVNRWQAYVVVPLVEESENFDARSLNEVYEQLSNGVFAGFKIGILHGRMSSEEKDRIMFDFRTGEIEILIATTVIEVGVDVPNANLMTIESAERFGLSQLHQLRGRIGRGKKPGYCTVFTSNQNDDAQKRLAAFASTSDGFKLAEEDLKIRGAGDLFGTQQHGIPPFKIADLSRDMEIVAEARKDAIEMVTSDPGLANPEHAKLRSQMLKRYGAVLNLGDVG